MSLIEGTDPHAVEGEAGVKKIIVIFTYNQCLLSIDMKTKVVQHVLRIIFKFSSFKFSKFSSFNFSKFSSFQSCQVFKLFRFPAPV